MSDTSKFLITTADECTWKFDRAVVFLSEWCRRHEKKYIWQKMNAIVAEPYGLALDKKIEDNFESRRIEKMMLNQLTSKLNKVHQTTHSERFWKILVGHWLRTYIETGLNRIKTLENCIAKYKISNAIFIELSRESVVPKNFDSFHTMLNSDAWNSNLDLQIINLLYDEPFPFEILRSQSDNFEQIQFYESRRLNKNILKNFIFHAINQISKYFSKDTDALIIDSYLPRSMDIKLNLRLGQLPQFWETSSAKVGNRVDLTLREELRSEFTDASKDKYEKILSYLLFNYLPICYLEGFMTLTVLAKDQNFPKSPRFIFTSNRFATDEVFKYWSAAKSEEGIKYFIGQHGANYGTNRFLSPSVEEEICDTFLTWGWGDDTSNYKSSFNFKTVNKHLVPNPKGGLLLNQLPLDYRRRTWDTEVQHQFYFEDQKIFISNLSQNIREGIVIRLHGMQSTQKFSEDLKWIEFDKKLKLDYGESPFFSIMSKYRLVVHSYDSTGFLECLTLNFPTMAFWQDGFDHLRIEAKPYYQELVDVGILHLSPKSISDNLNCVYADIESWWNQLDVQKARNKFCKKYSSQTQRPINDLIKILNGNLG